MMQRKLLIFIILSGSDRDPAVFLLKTSCLTRERERGRERVSEGYKQNRVDEVIYNGNENTKFNKIPEVALALLAWNILSLPCNFPLFSVSPHYSEKHFTLNQKSLNFKSIPYPEVLPYIAKAHLHTVIKSVDGGNREMQISKNAH